MKNPCIWFVTILYIAAVAVLVVLSVVIKKGDDVLLINGNHAEQLDAVFPVITYLGNGVIFLLLVIPLLFVKFRLAILSLVIWISHGIVCAIFKRAVFGGMKRPKAVMDNSLLHFVPNVDVPNLFSFPSGHTATIFCFALLVSLFLRNRFISAIMLTLALLVAYSRIYLLQHFLMDIAAGAVIGIVVTFFWWRVFDNKNLPAWMDNYLKLNVNLSLKHSGSN